MNCDGIHDESDVDAFVACFNDERQCKRRFNGDINLCPGDNKINTDDFEFLTQIPSKQCSRANLNGDMIIDDQDLYQLAELLLHCSDSVSKTSE
jgi:hypothetical protein